MYLQINLHFSMFSIFLICLLHQMVRVHTIHLLQVCRCPLKFSISPQTLSLEKHFMTMCERLLSRWDGSSPKVNPSTWNERIACSKVKSKKKGSLQFWVKALPRRETTAHFFITHKRTSDMKIGYLSAQYIAIYILKRSSSDTCILEESKHS